MTHREFHAEHAPSGFIDTPGWTLYGDGASKEHDTWGAFKAPSEDPLKLAKDIVTFLTLKLQQAVAAFDELKQSLHDAGRCAVRDGAPVVPPRERLEELKRLKADVDTIRAKLAEAQQVVEQAMEPHVKARKEQLAQRRAAGQAFLDELAEVTA